MLSAPRSLVAVLLLMPLLPARANSVPPSEELLRYVPADVSFCVVVREMREHLSQLVASPLVEQLRDNPMTAALRQSPEWVKLSEADQFLKQFLGVTAAELRDDIFGDAIVVAYRAGPPENPEKEEGLILLRARSAKRLATLMERINTVFKDNGELKLLEEREHEGVKYFRRVERKEETFYLLRGPVLVFSGQEAILKQAIAQERKLSVSTLSPVGRELQALGADKAMTSVWLNPRAFDATLSAQARQARGADATFLTTFLACWRALEGVAFTLDAHEQLEASLLVRGKFDTLPAPVRRFLEISGQRSELWSRFPEDALLATSARLSPVALLDLLAAFQPQANILTLKDDLNRLIGGALDKDLMTEILPHIGPDWGLCILPPPREGKAWFPSSVFAVRVAPGDPDAPLDRSLVEGLRSLAVLGATAYNLKKKELWSVKSTRHEGATLHYLSSASGQEMGLQPSFGVQGGYLILASSPDAFRRFVSAPAAKPSGDEVPLLRLSLKSLRQYLSARRTPLVAALAEQHQQTPEEIASTLDSVNLALQLLDRIEVVHKPSSNQVMFSVRIRPSFPLRK